MNGQEKVAALIFALLPVDKELVNRVLSSFEEAELAIISDAAKRCGIIPATELAHVVGQFARAWRVGAPVLGNERELNLLFDDVLEGKARQTAPIVVDEAGERKRSFNVDASKIDEIVRLVEAEPPYIASYILSLLETNVMAECLLSLDASVCSDIFREMLRAPQISSNADGVIRGALLDILEEPEGKKNEVERKVASVLNRFQRDQIDEIVSSLERSSPEQANKVSALLFDFNDLVRLPPESITVLVENLDIERVIVALQSAKEEIVALVLSSLGPRARRMVEQELAAEPQSDQGSVNEARREVANAVLELAQSGKISIPDR